MFYRPGIDDHGLPHNPFKAMISPRPIAWISTANPDNSGNLAPYSFFNAFSDAPPMLAYGTSGRKIGIDEDKDTLSNIHRTGEFVVNLVAAKMLEAMNISSQHFAAGEDEFAKAGLEKAACETVAAPRIAGAPASFECKLWKVLDLPGGVDKMVIGEVTGVHYDPACIRNGRFDVTTYQPIARLGYRDYARISDLFELDRPDD